MNLYPLLMAPYFCSGEETPWGGNMLRDAFMKDAPEQTGESLEVSTLPERESMVRNGIHAGKGLNRMVELWGDALTGKIAGDFPLLLKLIDAKENLPVQVLSDDVSTEKNEGSESCNAKAWIILNCEPGAKIAYGINLNDAPLSEISEQEEDAIKSAVNWINVRPGDVYYIPGGMAHTIGAGIQVYEIQQPKNANFGQLHICPTLDAANSDLQLNKLFGVTALCKGGSRTYYISNSDFELCRLNVSGKMPVCDGRMLLLTPLGCCTLKWADGELELMPFDSVVIPADMKDVFIESDDCKVFMSSPSNQEALRTELGYRAENVAGLTEV